MKKCTYCKSRPDSSAGYLPGLTDRDNADFSPYTRPYTGTNAVLARDGYIPASMSEHTMYPGLTPVNTPEPDADLPTKHHRHFGNLTAEEISLRIKTIDAAISSRQAQELPLLDELKSCRRDWELLLNDEPTMGDTSASPSGDLTASIEFHKERLQQERAKLIVTILQKEKSLIPEAIYETLEPKLEWEDDA